MDSDEGRMTEQSFLVAEGLRHNAENGTALVQDVSFSVDEGTILAIAGPNGAGKTTLLRLLSGSEAPTGGDVLVNGRNLKQLSATERARMIAVVSQQEMPDGDCSCAITWPWGKSRFRQTGPARRMWKT